MFLLIKYVFLVLGLSVVGLAVLSEPSRLEAGCDCDCKDPRPSHLSLPSLVTKVKPAGAPHPVLSPLLEEPSLVPPFSLVVTVHVYNDEGEVISQGSGWFITERVVVSTRHTLWKADLGHVGYAKARRPPDSLLTLCDPLHQVVTNMPWGSSEPAQQYLVKAVLVAEAALDLALLEVVPLVPRGRRSRPQPTLTVSVAPLMEGEDVVVISTPLGLPGVVSPGIVAAIHNDLDLQISSPVSTGSSGAPVLNRLGEVVGIVSGHLTSGQNLNFAASVRALARLVAQLRPSLNLLSTHQLPSSHAHAVQESTTTPPSHPIAPVAVWAAGGDFAAEVAHIEQERLRALCYPTLAEWAEAQSASLRKGDQKWTAAIKEGLGRLLESVWGNTTTGGNATLPPTSQATYPPQPNATSLDLTAGDWAAFEADLEALRRTLRHPAPEEDEEEAEVDLDRGAVFAPSSHTPQTKATNKGSGNG